MEVEVEVEVLHLLVHHLAGIPHSLHARRQLLDFLGGELAVFVVAEIVLAAGGEMRIKNESA